MTVLLFMSFVLSLTVLSLDRSHTGTRDLDRLAYSLDLIDRVTLSPTPLAARISGLEFHGWW
jgi:hypothetical protein